MQLACRTRILADSGHRAPSGRQREHARSGGERLAGSMSGVRRGYCPSSQGALTQPKEAPRNSRPITVMNAPLMTGITRNSTWAREEP